MSAANDGGPAFPCPVGHIECAHPEGMSLRDYFAAAVLDGMMANSVRLRATASLPDPELTYVATATEAYRIADAMLEARKEK